jgi:hypothetical protein
LEEIELALWVTHASGREYIASIIRSSCGVGTHRFVVPEDSSLLNDAEAGPAEHQRDVRRRTYVADRSPLMQLRQQGEELFRLVFAGENREPFRQCLNRAGEIGAWLRIKLIFHQAPAAADWPWEAMVVDWTGQFLANLPRVSIERAPGLAQSVAAPPTMRNGILRILILGASPAGLEKLDVRREKSRVAGVFRKAGIRTKVVVATTRAELDKATAVAIPFDIVHVICHGDFEENQGVLVLEGEREDGSRLVSPELTALLRRPAALVFLNACHSARRARDPFASFADSLLRAGTSAVIGMRRPIAEEAAQIIAPEFYQHLAAGEKVGRALAKWRELSPREDANWAVPVLYLGCEDFALLVPRDTSPRSAGDARGFRDDRRRSLLRRKLRPALPFAAWARPADGLHCRRQLRHGERERERRAPGAPGHDLQELLPRRHRDHHGAVRQGPGGSCAGARRASAEGGPGVQGRAALRRGHRETRARSEFPAADRSAMGVRRARRSPGRRHRNGANRRQL